MKCEIEVGKPDWRPLENAMPPEFCVGSRTGALMLGSGGHSFAFAQDLSPVTMITSPVPATSNRTGAFDASGFPIDFTIELSGIPFAHE
jgi:hypothetical protein